MGADLLFVLRVVLAFEFEAEHLVEVIPEFVIHYVQLFALNESPVDVDCVELPEFTFELLGEDGVIVRDVDEAVLSY